MTGDPSNVRIREAAHTDLPRLGRLGALLVQEHHADVVQQNLKGRVGVEILPDKKNVISPRGERTVTLQLHI
jgi:hypothetical protein